MFFEYGEKETEYLKSRDKRLGKVIDSTGHIKRQTDDNLFSSVVHHIIGQQISAKAQETIWQRMKDKYGIVSPETIGDANINELQSLGITFRKAGYIKDFSEKVIKGEFDLNAVEKMPDQEAVKALSGLKGIGTWTAEMILLFCLKRPDILSYSDLAIQRGMKMVYHHRKIDKKLFEKYRKRFSPYCSVASLYFWAVAGGAVPELKAPAAIKGKKQMYINYYNSPLGRMTLASDGDALTGLWFECQKYFGSTLLGEQIQKELPVFEETKKWLDIYFSGKEPDFTPRLSMEGATPFRKTVWEILLSIPYGHTMSYGRIAEIITEQRGTGKMSARAVGGATGRNPFSIIVPCHRVIGAGGQLTGYAGGIELKQKLLDMEKKQSMP